MKSIEVRPAALGDVPSVAALEAENFSFPWREADFEKMIAETDRVLLCAFCGGEFAGYIGAYTVAGETEVSTVAVLPAFRRRGIGQSLVHGLLEALGEGCTVFLEVRKSNAVARTLYEKNGFVQVGERRGYYQKPPEDAVLYRYEQGNF